MGPEDDGYMFITEVPEDPRPHGSHPQTNVTRQNDPSDWDQVGDRRDGD